MKKVNLRQLIDSWNSLDTDIFKKYISYVGIGSAQNGVRESELNDMACIVKCLCNSHIGIDKYDGFFVNYSIPQIGKEFDLLRFGKNFILNVEVKRNSTIDKIEKQLKRNQYYLAFVGIQIKLFSFIADTKDVYTLKNEHIIKTNIAELANCLKEQIIDNETDPDIAFNPAHYLVSPFNSTQKFINNGYFLTKQQEEIKKTVMEMIESGNIRHISITGKAGTGKTLLTYDIAKTAILRRKKVLILHCAQLNKGQQLLNNDYGWNIVQTRQGLLQNFNDYEVIIIDEAQRARSPQFSTFIEKINSSSAICIFSHDGNQCLNNYEIQQDISRQIIAFCDDKFTLTNKIRTNKEIADFIIRLFDSKSIHNVKDYPNVSISYCSNAIEAKSILTMLNKRGWKTPMYTPGTRSTFHYEEYGVPGEDSVHAVIGQEYDNVVGVIDSHFYYDDKSILQSRKDGYYSQRQMLFQILTRTRMKLHLLFLNNPEVFKRCIEIIS